MNPDLPPTALETISRIREILETSRHQALTAVNTTMVRAYWMIGREITEEELRGADRAGYGTRLIETIAERLTAEFGKGFIARNLWYMRDFYQAFPIVNALRSELSWTHYRLLTRVGREDARAFYTQEAIQARWSTRELERQIGSFLFERLAKSRDETGVRTLAEQGATAFKPTDLLRDPFVLEFTGLPERHAWHEADLEQALIDRLQEFLLELGRDFFYALTACFTRRPPKTHHHKRRSLLHRPGVLSPHVALLRADRPENREINAARHWADAFVHRLLRGRRDARGREPARRSDLVRGQKRGGGAVHARATDRANLRGAIPVVLTDRGRVAARTRA